MKLGILVCAACGLASAFAGGDASVWAARGAMGPSVWLYVIGFAGALAIGAWTLRRAQERHHAIFALCGTALSLYWFRGELGSLVALGPLRAHTLPSMLYAVGLYGGAICALAAIAKPEKR